MARHSLSELRVQDTGHLTAEGTRIDVRKALPPLQEKLCGEASFHKGA